jgi:hypothetical protein
VTTFSVVEAEGRWLDQWDDYIEQSVNGTLFHLRQFLTYHRDRFLGEERYLLVLGGDSVVAQIPVAIGEEDGVRRLRSPYGASYGGFAFQRYPTFSQSCDIVAAFIEWMHAEQVREATLTPPIAVCARLPFDVVHFALLSAGFKSVNRDISSLVPLDQGTPIGEAVTARARNHVRHAEREGVTIKPRGDLDDFWSVLDSTFDRHGVPPTHSLDEFRWLAEELPDRVYVDVAYHGGLPVAGIGYFVINHIVNSSFYLCQRPDYRALNGLTLCVLHGLERARQDGYRWFDFGTSTDRMQPRENIFRFKEHFSPVGQFRETFEWIALGA